MNFAQTTVTLPTLEWTAADTVSRRPQSIGAFLRLGMACVGCAMDSFDTKQEAARNYGLDPAQVLNKVSRTI
ncbi:MAG: hypothetical protein HY318_02130 [Armatimonadetes bacterium]|nr:hypothetical protein [Armatimonadota bacterium]